MEFSYKVQILGMQASLKIYRMKENSLSQALNNFQVMVKGY